jgi:hypothetical protein
VFLRSCKRVQKLHRRTFAQSGGIA